MSIEINITNKSACCACGACLQKCPKKCITFIDDNEGFLYPQVDKDICVDCGLCEKVCPFLNTNEPTVPLQILAVKNKNEQERMKSSSGGIFLPLAREIIAENGVVFGAVFDNNWQVKIDYALTLDQVYPMMGSKYVQAYTATAYQDAQKFLNNGRKVLFTGTPCQIAGLKHYLQKDYDNLLTMDILCYGTPSPGVWRKYLHQTTQNDTINNITFRDKTISGWKKYNLIINCDNKQIAMPIGEKQNYYMRGFLADIYLRPSCYNCQCKSGKSHSDLTVGDFWNLQSMMPDFDDNIGVSIALINSDKGKQYFSKLDLETRPATMDNLHMSNFAYDGCSKPHPKRDLFFEMYNNDEPLDKTLEICLYLPLYKRMEKFFLRCVRFAIRKIKKIINH